MQTPFLKITNQTFLNYYYKQLNIDKLSKKKLLISRAQPLLGIHINSIVYVHQGRTLVRFKVTKYHVGFKAGSFTSTKKPFFFRSKKKSGKRDLRR